MNTEEKENFKYLLDEMGRLLCFAFELKSTEGIALAVMLDSALRYGQSIYLNNDPRISEEVAYQLKLRKDTKNKIHVLDGGKNAN